MQNLPKKVWFWPFLKMSQNQNLCNCAFRKNSDLLFEICKMKLYFYSNLIKGGVLENINTTSKWATFGQISHSQLQVLKIYSKVIRLSRNLLYIQCSESKQPLQKLSKVKFWPISRGWNLNFREFHLCKIAKSYTFATSEESKLKLWIHFRLSEVPNVYSWHL